MDYIYAKGDSVARSLLHQLIKQVNIEQNNPE